MISLPNTHSIIQSGNLMSPVVLNGTVPNGRFGTSITNLGDINFDTYEGPYIILVYLTTMYRERERES